MRAVGSHNLAFSSPTSALAAVVGLRSLCVRELVRGRAARSAASPPQVRDLCVTRRAAKVTRFYTVVAAFFVPYTGAPARRRSVLHCTRRSDALALPSPMTPRFRHPDSPHSRGQLRGPARVLVGTLVEDDPVRAARPDLSFSNLPTHLFVRDAPAGYRVRGSKVQINRQHFATRVRPVVQPVEGPVS